jgi:sec-independent protein translocase protein TatA
VPLGLGIWEILILAGVLLLLFGAKGAPAMARRLGTGVKEMKDAVTEMDPRSILDPKDKPAEAPQRQLEATKAVPVAAPAAAAAPVAAAPVAAPPEGAAKEPATPEGESPAS